LIFDLRTSKSLPRISKITNGKLQLGPARCAAPRRRAQRQATETNALSAHFAKEEISSESVPSSAPAPGGDIAARLPYLKEFELCAFASFW
jgi:hypothetical protein